MLGIYLIMHVSGLYCEKSVFLAIPRESFTSITSVVPGCPVMETQISPWCVELDFCSYCQFASYPQFLYSVKDEPTEFADYNGRFLECCLELSELWVFYIACSALND